MPKRGSVGNPSFKRGARHPDAATDTYYRDLLASHQLEGFRSPNAQQPCQLTTVH